MSVILRVLPDIAIRSRHLSRQSLPLFRLNRIILKNPLFTKSISSVSAEPIVTTNPPITAANQQQSQPGSKYESATLEWVNRNGLCGQLSENDVGKRVRLCGWVALHRGHGGLTFINLRDHSGIVQVTTLPNEFPEAHSMVNDLRIEYVVSVEGVVRLRPSDSVNKNMKTGMIEVTAEIVQVLNSVRAKLPFLVTSAEDAKDSIKEEIRLRCLLEAYSVGASSSRHSQCCSEFRNFTSGYELSRKPFSKISHLGIGSLKTPSSLLGSHRQYATNVIREQKSRKMLYYLTGLVFAMVGCTYASVPLYRRFCQATGYGGTVQRRETVEEKIARHAQDGTVTNREITVQFNADVSDGMPWKFIPTQREVRVKPGESALAFYTAENRSATPITGMSTYNVTPMKAAVYFNKIQCFCFEEQRLLPGEQIDMPVFFYIDPEFETDPRMDGIDNIILSYTFFKIGEEKL